MTFKEGIIIKGTLSKKAEETYPPHFYFPPKILPVQSHRSFETGTEVDGSY